MDACRCVPLLRSAPAGQHADPANSATLHPASAGTAHQGQGRPGWPRGQHGSPFSYPGPAALRRRPHAFHTGARRWNRGHSRDSAKSPDGNERADDGLKSIISIGSKNPELYYSTLYGKEMARQAVNTRSIWFLIPRKLPLTAARSALWRAASRRRLFGQGAV